MSSRRRDAHNLLFHLRGRQSPIRWPSDRIQFDQSTIPCPASRVHHTCSQSNSYPRAECARELSLPLCFAQLFVVFFTAHFHPAHPKIARTLYIMPSSARYNLHTRNYNLQRYTILILLILDSFVERVFVFIATALEYQTINRFYSIEKTK